MMAALKKPSRSHTWIREWSSEKAVDAPQDRRAPLLK
jgi:hypothetical protein